MQAEQYNDMTIMKNKVFDIPNVFGFDITLDHFDLKEMCISTSEEPIVVLGENN